MNKIKCPVWSRVENKGEGKMYGLLLESVQYYVIQDVGEETWKKILAHAGIKNIVFTTHNTYRDELMTLLAQSCCHVTKTKDYNQWMTFFGTCFVEFCATYGYDKLLRVTGRNYRDFLHGIDNIHEVIRFSYPRLQSPAFLVLTEDKEGCVMLYQTKRRGFKHYVIGQLQQVAKRFYKISVTITVIEEEIIDRKTHVKFRLDFDNSAYVPKFTPKQHSGNQTFSSITGDTFLKVFPFCIVFNSQLVIRMVGSSMVALLKDNGLVGATFREKFHIRRPLIPCIWSKILQFRRVIFEVEYLFDNDPVELDAQLIEHDNSEPERGPDHRILLRGQMKYLQEWNMTAFLCTPLLCDLKDLQKAGLFINDLNLFDMSRDMVMAGWQHASQLERSIEEQRENTEKITENMSTLEVLKTKSDSLLYNMIPKSVAGKLKSGHDPVSTCEIFDNVTIMFNYMVGFGDVCSSATPMEIVEIINSVFSLFDQIIDSYDVFKVETLGDAVYMVAGGVPDRNPNHAINVAGLALELQEKAKTLTEPWSKQYKLNTRIGMHTGSVVGGVVGRRMPQYCLFGDTVNTASRMQTYSLPGRIHISEPCQECLKQSSFVTIVRGTVNIKGKGDMRTFWLAGKEGEESTRQFCEDIKQERNQSVRKYSLAREMRIKFRTRSPTRRSYENAMDLHAMHASTSYAQMPAYFGGMKSNRSASSVSLATLQQSDDEDGSEIKTGDRPGIKGSPRSYSRLSEYTNTVKEKTDQLLSCDTKNLKTEKIDIHFALDEGELENFVAGSEVEADKKEQRSRIRSDNSLQTMFNIPEIVEHDVISSTESSSHVNSIENETEKPLALGRFKLSLPKMSGLFHLLTAKDDAKARDIRDSRNNNDAKATKEEKDGLRKDASVETGKFTVFLGSDDGLSIYDTENTEHVGTSDNPELVHSGKCNEYITFCISKIGSSHDDSEEETLLNDVPDENAKDKFQMVREWSFSCTETDSVDQNSHRKGDDIDPTSHYAKDVLSQNSYHACNYSAVSKSIKDLSLATTFPAKNEKSEGSKVVSLGNAFTNVYTDHSCTDSETYSHGLSADITERANTVDKKIPLEILSCPFFSCIANGGTRESSDVNAQNLTKCKTDQGIVNGNHTNSGNEFDKLDNLIPNTKACNNSKEIIIEHGSTPKKSESTSQEEKLKLLEKGIKFAWGLHNDTVPPVRSDRIVGETFGNNKNSDCCMNGQMDAKGQNNNILNGQSGVKFKKNTDIYDHFSKVVFHLSDEDSQESS
ncbi:uncharacterized protein LOC123537544 isoform X3 [Mercenaria mercenaria]|uniref:uncharacterized protein LOC123537544 isoform X3 n=1 Tax=Mercenaria mercenaria TaxID=6596 RepID=UPI00234E62AA|nr:uncharacterized protein LOC123537544 isoform X3 [Mercenaria mercenaria]